MSSSVSKTMSYLLRHGAEKEGIAMGSDGWARVEDLLAQPQMKGVTLKLLKQIVRDCPKQRFELGKEDTLIRAT